MSITKLLDTKQFKDFLVETKIKTYNYGIKRVILPDGSKFTRYKKGHYIYEDIICGNSDHFYGKEKVYFEKTLIWHMDYTGDVTSKIISSEKIWHFLLTALKKIKIDRPFLGPPYFRKGIFEYIEETRKIDEIFKGRMNVFYNGLIVFAGSYDVSFKKEHFENDLFEIRT